MSRVIGTQRFDGFVRGAEINREQPIYAATRIARKQLESSIVELALGRMVETSGQGGKFDAPRLTVPYSRAHRLGEESSELARAAEFAAQHLRKLNLGLVVLERLTPSEGDSELSEISRFVWVAPMESALLELSSPEIAPEGDCAVRILYPPQE